MEESGLQYNRQAYTQVLMFAHLIRTPTPTYIYTYSFTSRRQSILYQNESSSPEPSESLLALDGVYTVEARTNKSHIIDPSECNHPQHRQLCRGFSTLALTAPSAVSALSRSGRLERISGMSIKWKCARIWSSTDATISLMVGVTDSSGRLDRTEYARPS